MFNQGTAFFVIKGLSLHTSSDAASSSGKTDMNEWLRIFRMQRYGHSGKREMIPLALEMSSDERHIAECGAPCVLAI